MKYCRVCCRPKLSLIKNYCYFSLSELVYHDNRVHNIHQKQSGRRRKGRGEEGHCSEQWLQLTTRPLKTSLVPVINGFWATDSPLRDYQPIWLYFCLQITVKCYFLFHKPWKEYFVIHFSQVNANIELNNTSIKERQRQKTRFLYFSPNLIVYLDLFEWIFFVFCN